MRSKDKGTKALKLANDKHVREEADIKCKETLEQVQKVCDEIMDKAEKVFRDAISK